MEQCFSNSNVQTTHLRILWNYRSNPVGLSQGTQSSAFQISSRMMLMVLVQLSLGSTLIEVLWLEETDVEQPEWEKKNWGDAEKQGLKLTWCFMNILELLSTYKPNTPRSIAVSLGILGTHRLERTIYLGSWCRYDSICIHRMAKKIQNWLTKECVNLENNKLLLV